MNLHEGSDRRLFGGGVFIDSMILLSNYCGPSSDDAEMTKSGSLPFRSSQMGKKTYQFTDGKGSGHYGSAGETHSWGDQSRLPGGNTHELRVKSVKVIGNLRVTFPP